MNRRIQELLSGFRVKVFDQLGRVLDVGEQDGDLLALTLQGIAGGQNLIGQEFRRIRLGLTAVPRQGVFRPSHVMGFGCDIPSETLAGRGLQGKLCYLCQLMTDKLEK